MTSIAAPTPSSNTGARPALPEPAAPAPAPVPTTFADDPYDPAVVAARVAAGRRAETTADALPDDLVGRPAPGYFRTFEQVKGAMYELQARFPDLVEVRDIGDTAEKVAGKADRDVLALVITNTKTGAPGTKPATMHVGGIHAREIANPELLMTFATQLLEGHGTDADATMFVDDRETIIVPMLNADGHAVVERGFANASGGNTMQRKSTMAGEPSRGTDLNRNFGFHWGGAGASSNPSSETYRGPAAASEPETKAIQAFVQEREPEFFVDWHSYSKLNMYPWGDTKEKAKDFAGFDAMARKMTTYNGHSPMQAIGLYPTTGTTDDHVYGTHDIPAMVIETGSSFHQSDAEFQDTLGKNLPVLRYVVRAADAPLQRVFGPDVTDVRVDDREQVTASITDANNGAKALAAAELVLSAKDAPGTGRPLVAADGRFDSVAERVTGAIGVREMADGALVYVRGKDVDGNWGPLTPQWISGPRGA